MIAIIFAICMAIVFMKVLTFAIKMSWGLVKMLGCIVFVPMALILIFATGFSYLAFFILLIIGAVSLIKPAVH